MVGKSLQDVTRPVSVTLTSCMYVPAGQLASCFHTLHLNCPTPPRSDGGRGEGREPVHVPIHATVHGRNKLVPSPHCCPHTLDMPPFVACASPSTAAAAAIAASATAAAATTSHAQSVTQRGVSGEQVLKSMHGRLGQELHSAESAGVRYNWVLLLAGINDLGKGSEADRVFCDGLLQMYTVSAAVL
eukprot:190945-Chlamydomonas_euryale.AAC.5